MSTFIDEVNSLPSFRGLQVGTIQRQIGQVDEAVNSFSDVLALDPNSRLALDGAGEAYLSQAHARTSEGLYTAAASALSKGCDVIRRYLSIQTLQNEKGELLRKEEGSSGAGEGKRAGEECAWKLLGDLYTYGHKLPAMSFLGAGGVGGACEGDDGEAHQLGSKEESIGERVSENMFDNIVLGVR